MFKEFKEFISKGNALDLAIGMIMGTSFSAIVNSLVNDIIMPIIGTLIGIDFSGWTVVVNNSPIAVGLFIQAIVNFLIIAFVLFVIIKAINKMRKPAPEVPAADPEELVLLRQIRDSLRK